MIGKRITAGVLCALMALGAVPAGAYAEDNGFGILTDDSFTAVTEDDIVSAELDAQSLEAAPGRVTDLRVGKVTENAYTMAWKAVKGAAGYKIYRYNAKTKKYRLIKTTKKTRIRISGLKAGQKNTYRVTAYTTENGKTLEGKAMVGKFTSKPAQVQLMKVKMQKKGYITFRWRRVKNATAYNLYYSTNGKNYKLFKTVKGNVGEVTTGLIPTGQKLRFRVRAVSKHGNCIQLGKSSPMVRSMAFNKKSVNDIMNSYSNSYSVTQVNAQGFKLTQSQKDAVAYQMTRCGGSAAYMLYDIDSGSAVAYNANTYFGTASTVKMPYILYSLRCMEDGDPTMDKLLTYTPADYNGGSSWIKTQPFYSQYTIKRVMELISEYSDNCGYYMLQDEFGFSGYNKFIESLGATPWITPTWRWGNVNCVDSTREWACMWRYMNKGRYRKFARHIFGTTCAADIRHQLGNRYYVYEKSGWTGDLHNETALVRAEHPYIIICLTTVDNDSRMYDVAEVSESIHNAMWNYYGS